MGPETPFIDAEVKRDPTSAGNGWARKPPPRGRRHRSRSRPGPRSPKTTNWPTSPPARSSTASFSPARARSESVRRQVLCGIRGLWERRSSEVAQTVVVGLYPSWDISDKGIAEADKFLDDSSCRRRFAGWFSRAAPAWSGRCGRVTSTAAGRPDPAAARYAGEMPELVTRIALTRPSISSPS